MDDNTIAYMVQFLGLSHMCMLKRTCKRFYSIVVAHPLYQKYRDETAEVPYSVFLDTQTKTITDGHFRYDIEFLQTMSTGKSNIDEVEPREIGKIEKDPIVQACEQTEDRTWLKYYLKTRTEKDDKHKFSSLPFYYKTSTVQNLLEENHSTWSDTYSFSNYQSLPEEDKATIRRFYINLFDDAVRYGLVGSILSGNTDLTRTYLSYGANKLTALYAASYAGDITLVREFLPAVSEQDHETTMDNLYHVFKQGVEKNNIDIIRAVIEYPSVDKNYLKDQISDNTGNYLVCRKIRDSTHIVDYLMKNGILEDSVVVGWALLTGRYEYITPLRYKIDWNDIADIAEGQFCYDRSSECPRAYLYCLMNGATRVYPELFLDTPIHKQGLEYLVNHRGATWRDLFLKACDRLSGDGIEYCLDRISAESKREVITMGLESTRSYSTDSPELKKKKATIENYLSDILDRLPQDTCETGRESSAIHVAKKRKLE
jgi:hypothetical protein